MDRLIYRLNYCIDKDDYSERIKALEELIDMAQRRLNWEREYLREKEVAKALNQIEAFSE